MYNYSTTYTVSALYVYTDGSLSLFSIKGNTGLVSKGGPHVTLFCRIAPVARIGNFINPIPENSPFLGHGCKVLHNHLHLSCQRDLFLCPPIVSCPRS